MNLHQSTQESGSTSAQYAELTFTPPAGRLHSLNEDQLVRSALSGNREALRTLKRLPSTRSEVMAVGNVYGSQAHLLLGPEASEQELCRMASSGELSHFRVLHFATHALVDDERPGNSALILSQVDLPDPLEAAISGSRVFNGCLYASEIARNWDLHADLVTLSACETALGKEVPGEGYVGLADAFLLAGSNNLIVSLWKVEDRSTSMLMQRFYEDLSGKYEGVRGAEPDRRPGSSMLMPEALQEAKRWLRSWKDENGHQPYRHPFFWAGFVLIGAGS